VRDGPHCLCPKAHRVPVHPKVFLHSPLPFSRHTVLLPPHVSVVPATPGLCRLRSAPAGRRTFPTFSLRISPCVLGPLPRRLVRCACPFLPSRQRPSPRADRVGAPPCPVQRLQYGALVEAAVIHSGSGPQVCSPPRSLLPLRPPPSGSRDFSIRASHGLLPPRAPDMLTVCIGQLTVWGLPPP
jgi:hypothetical protein